MIDLVTRIVAKLDADLMDPLRHFNSVEPAPNKVLILREEDWLVLRDALRSAPEAPARMRFVGWADDNDALYSPVTNGHPHEPNQRPKGYDRPAFVAQWP